MTKHAIRFFVLTASLMLNLVLDTGSARAQADAAIADSVGAAASVGNGSASGLELADETRNEAPDDLAAAADTWGDGRDAENSRDAVNGTAERSALASCAMAVELGQACTGLEEVATVTDAVTDAVTDSRFASEFAPAADRAQQTWSKSPLPVLSSEDREAIGRVAYAEAGNQGEEGIAAVIFTILNRVLSGQFQDSVQGVIDAPNQFEPATRAGGWRYLPPLDLTESIQFETILNLILVGRLADPTRGALFFQNTRIVIARAAAGAVSPHLIDFGGTSPVAEIGDHRFYDERAAINLFSARRGSRAEDTDTASATDGLAYGQEGEVEFLAAEPGSDDASSLPALSEGSDPQLVPAEDEQQPS